MVSGLFPSLLPLGLLLSCGLSARSGAEGGGSVVSFAGNLDARAPVFARPFSVDDPGNSSQLSAIVSVRGEESGRFPVAVYFRKEQPSVFGFYVMAETVETSVLAEGSAQSGGSTQPALVAEGTLHFDTDGGLLSVVPGEPIQVHFRGAPRSQTIAIHFGTTKEDGGDGLSGLTQYALASSITYQSGD